MPSIVKKIEADKLHILAQKLEDEGRSEEAIETYGEALALHPMKAESHYNLGLIYKYRCDWRNSFICNQAAHRIRPTDQATRWNLAIAATAVRDWCIARQMWTEEGIALDGEGPIEADFGITPVRLNAENDGEVVWGRRIDPVRIRISNIPWPNSGFHYGDIVLHDGAPVGSRLHHDRQYGVFNVLELFERSPFSTIEAEIEIAHDAALAVLEVSLVEQACAMEDWTENVRPICRQCSEGLPHEHHVIEDQPLFRARRRIGIAARSMQAIEDVLNEWASAEGARILSIVPETAP